MVATLNCTIYSRIQWVASFIGKMVSKELHLGCIYSGHVKSCLRIIFQYKPISSQYSRLSVVWASFSIQKKIIPVLTCLFQDKCAPYFPDPVECPQTLPTEYTDIGIGVKLSERLNKGTYIRREYSIYNRKVCMFTWWWLVLRVRPTKSHSS